MDLRRSSIDVDIPVVATAQAANAAKSRVCSFDISSSPKPRYVSMVAARASVVIGPQSLESTHREWKVRHAKGIWSLPWMHIRKLRKD